MAAADAANEARLAAAKNAAKTLTQAEIAAKTAEQVAAGVKSTDRAARLPGETATEANARITAAYKEQPKPELTQEGKAAGATIEFVRTGAGGVGVYKEVFPTGVPIPTVRTTVSGAQVDATGKPTGETGTPAVATVPADKVVTSTPAVNPNATLAAGGSSAGKDSTGKEIFYKTEGGNGVSFYYADGSKVPVDNLVGVPQTVDFANAGWSIQGLPVGQTPASVKYADIIRNESAKGTQPGGNSYIAGDVVVVNDVNGVSLYNLDGKLISAQEVLKVLDPEVS